MAKELTVKCIDNETSEQAIARTLIDPTTVAAILTVSFTPVGCDLGFKELSAAIKTVVEQVQSGDLSDVESMLVSQAKALQAMFVSLSEKALEQRGVTAYQMMMNMALKAQNQCRTTLQTLLELKFPRTTAFVKQQNIANGPQQVNNGIQPDRNKAQPGTSENLTQEIENEQSKLSIEDTRHERESLDIRRMSEASGTDKEMETVEKINRPKNKSRKSKSIKKRI